MYLDFTFDFVFSSFLYSIGRRFRRNVIGNFNSSAWRHFILGEIFELLLTARVPVPRLSWSRSMINDPREKSGEGGARNFEERFIYRCIGLVTKRGREFYKPFEEGKEGKIGSAYQLIGLMKGKEGKERGRLLERRRMRSESSRSR